MSWGNGQRRRCPECGQSVLHLTDVLSHRELRGPRGITSSNIDRVFDNNGHLLFIEEKNDGEARLQTGQRRLLSALASPLSTTVWFAKGEPSRLVVAQYGPSEEPLAYGDFATYQQLIADWFRQTDSVAQRVLG